MDTHKALKIVVTGAASGIGRAAAEALRDAGAQVIGFDIALHALRFPILRCDLTDERQVVSAMTEASERMGGIDALVNSAGIGHSSRLEQFDLDAFDLMMAVNVRGSILAAREALRHFNGGGRIVNVASELGYLGRAGASGYCATKGAILALTRSWARELAPNVPVNAVAPGPIDTPLLGFSSLSAEKRALEQSNPMGRVGSPEEVAQAILFLLHPKTGFITGQCISIDGGAAMH